jgi:Kef-type K+ transport system membrane component KefB
MTDALLLLPVGALFVAIWVAGELFGLVRAPLVGQMVVGLLLGPGLLDLVPHSEAFALVGLVGLLLLVEGGLHMDLNTLRVVG